jgi:hypothetical protein
MAESGSASYSRFSWFCFAFIPSFSYNEFIDQQVLASSVLASIIIFVFGTLQLAIDVDRSKQPKLDYCAVPWRVQKTCVSDLLLEDV